MVMNKMRESAKWLFIALIVSFVITIVFEWGMDFTGMQSRPNEAGRVNGKPITLKEYERLCKLYIDNYRQQVKGAEIDEALDMRIRDQVWSDLVEREILEKEYETQRISVSDQEIVDAIFSDNPPEFIAQQFRDQKTGKINKEALMQAAAAPENKKAWIQVEDYVRQLKMREKLERLTLASARASDEEARQKFLQDRLRLTGKFVLLDFSQTKPDSMYAVSDGEIAAYYRDHRDDYKQEPVRAAKFVFFPNTPTSEDTLSIENDLKKLIREFAETKNDTDFINIHGDAPPNFGKIFTRGMISPELDSLLYKGELKAGMVFGPIREFGEFKLIKITEVKENAEPLVRASHVLLQPSGSSKADTLKTIAEAKDLLNRIKKGKISFEDAARQYSKDGSAQNGGDLGWFGKGRMVKPFEDASFSGKVGDLLGPVQTQFGVHLIKITGRDSREVRGVELIKKIVPSPSTIERQRRAASEFQYFASEEGFDKEAERKGYEVRQTGQFFKGGFIPMLGVSNGVTKFAFNAKENQISDVIAVKDGFAVMQLTEKNDDGYRRLDDNLKRDIKNKIIREKKLAELREKAKKLLEQAGNDIQKFASLDSGNVAREFNGVSLQSPNIPGLGREANFVSILSALEVNQLSKPIDTNRGVAVAMLTAKETGKDEEFESQKETLRNQLWQEKRNQIQQNWLQALKKKADIEDNRAMFY
ncbi:MAG: peptidylprolyl isomerase [Chloroherpetonaceae bacterium]|nr:peptidylprolyl isomerase [Chloroherpetonaceae bacterium]MDW8437674.1 peptidylprolyl isomerase [Chloroherpetonaceae bacterium]